jgi:hypothetical protein
MFEHPEVMRQIVSERAETRRRAAEQWRQARRDKPRPWTWALRSVLARH